jgi:hypothetical protein
MATKKAVKTESPIEVITEYELIAVETTRLQLQEARKKVKQAELALEGRQKDIIRKLKSGAHVEGSKTAIITEELGQCRPAWKDLYVEHFQSEHGETLESIVLRAQAAYPATSHEVLVIGSKPASV